MFWTNSSRSPTLEQTPNPPAIDQARQQALEKEHRTQILAFRQNELPTDPVPALRTLIAGVQELGPEWLKTDSAKAVVHLINILTHGQSYQLDYFDEWTRLYELVG